MAGYIPGILWGLGCMILTFFLATKRGMKGKEMCIRDSSSHRTKKYIDKFPKIGYHTCIQLIQKDLKAFLNEKIYGFRCFIKK